MSNLLEKASIVTTPTAYSDGVLHSVKPEQTLSSELITNGGFDTSIPIGTAGSGWKFIDSNNAGSSGEYYQGGVRLTRTNNLSRFRPLVGNTNSTSFFPLESRNYVISYDLISTTNSSKNVSMSAGGQSVQLPGTVGSHTVYFKNGGTSTLCQFSPGNNTDIVLDNISMKEVIDADFTFTRNNPGTRVNSSGNIESIAGDLPRIDYLGGSGSWLLEPEATNTATDSNDFTTGDIFVSSGRAISGVVRTSNQAISPDGTNNAWSIVDNNDGGIGNSYYRWTSLNVLTNTYNTLSLFVKKQGNNDWVYLRTLAFSDAGGLVFFNISNGTLGYTDSVLNPSIEDYGNGWYRISITFNTVDSSGIIQLALATSDANNNITRDGTNGVYIYGIQAESHATREYATSYIPTSGGTGTRGADSATDAGSSDLISSTEGVLYAEIAALSDELDGTYKVIALNNGIVDEYVLLGFTDINNIYASVGGTFISSLTPTDATEFHKVAIKYEDNNCKLFINGVQVGTTNTTATVPNGLNNLDFHTGIGGSPFNGNVKCVAVFKEALTDAELTCLTTI